MDKTAKQIRLDALNGAKEELNTKISELTKKINDGSFLFRTLRKNEVEKLKGEIKAIDEEIRNVNALADDAVPALDYGKLAGRYAVYDAKHTSKLEEAHDWEETKSSVDEKNTTKFDKIKEGFGKLTSKYNSKIESLKKKAVKIEGKQRRIAIRSYKKENPYLFKVGRAQGLYDYKNQLYEDNLALATAAKDGTIGGFFRSIACDIKGFFYRKSRDRALSTLTKLQAKENVWRNGRTVIIPKAPVNTPPGDTPPTEPPVEELPPPKPTIPPIAHSFWGGALLDDADSVLGLDEEEEGLHHTP